MIQHWGGGNHFVCQGRKKVSYLRILEVGIKRFWLILGSRIPLFLGLGKDMIGKYPSYQSVVVNLLLAILFPLFDRKLYRRHEWKHGNFSIVISSLGPHILIYVRNRSDWKNHIAYILLLFLLDRSQRRSDAKYRVSVIRNAIHGMRTLHPIGSFSFTS